MKLRFLALSLVALSLALNRPVLAAETPPPAKPGYKVTVKISFDEKGVGQGAEVVESDDPTSDTVLQRVALTLAAQVQQPPHLKDGKPVAFSAIVPFDFPVEGDEGAAANNAPKPRPHNPGERPVYPDNLARAGVVGGAILELIIGTDGVVKKVTVLDASNPEFGQSAETAVHTWGFIPAEKDGKPVESRWRVCFAFTVNGKDVDWKWRVAPRPSMGGSVVYSHLSSPAAAAATLAPSTTETPPAPPAETTPEKK